MKVATYNVKGVNGRLPVLLRWLEEVQPDVVCLQEVKAPDERFPISTIEQAGYGNGGKGTVGFSADRSVSGPGPCGVKRDRAASVAALVGRPPGRVDQVRRCPATVSS